MPTWDEYERATAYRRPDDWQERPDGPDKVDWFVADMRAVGGDVTRREALAAMHSPGCRNPHHDPAVTPCTGRSLTAELNG